MRAGCLAVLDQPQAPGHSEMNEGSTASGAREQVLGPSRESGDELTLEAGSELRWYRPPQARLPDHDPADSPSDQSSLEAAPDRLDLG